MKSIYVVILISSALCLESCYSLIPLAETEHHDVSTTDNETIVITLQDGTRIESPPYHHTQVSEPSEFVLGTGERLSKENKNEGVFEGKIIPVRIDPGEKKYERGVNSWEHSPYHDFWLSDTSKIRCFDKDFIAITKAEGTGFWCVGSVNNKTYKGRILPENIKSVEVRRFALEETAIWIVGTPLCVYGVIYVFSSFPITLHLDNPR